MSRIGNFRKVFTHSIRNECFRKVGLVLNHYFGRYSGVHICQAFGFKQKNLYGGRSNLHISLYITATEQRAFFYMTLKLWNVATEAQVCRRKDASQNYLDNCRTLHFVEFESIAFSRRVWIVKLLGTPEYLHSQD